MKLKGFFAMAVSVGVSLLAGCGGGRDYLASSNKLSSVNDVESSLTLNDADADVKFAKKPKGGGKGKKKKKPPVINSASVNPTTLDIIGGAVSVTTNVTSNNAALVVSAQASTAGFAPINVNLSPTGGGNFSGNIQIPGSFNGATRVYQITVIANDGKFAPVNASAGTVTVKLSSSGGGGGDGPPPPPFFP